MSGPAALFATWRGALRGDLARARDRAAVRLLAEPARPPATPIERLLVDTLVAKGPLSRSALVSVVARAVYRDELAQSGWLAALGFFSEDLFIAEVTRALEGARGVLWEFEPAVVSD
jgi:hypothetical protein